VKMPAPTIDPTPMTVASRRPRRRERGGGGTPAR
jgi:hypothetical protein